MLPLPSSQLCKKVRNMRVAGVELVALSDAQQRKVPLGCILHWVPCGCIAKPPLFADDDYVYCMCIYIYIISGFFSIFRNDWCDTSTHPDCLMLDTLWWFNIAMGNYLWNEMIGQNMAIFYGYVK